MARTGDNTATRHSMGISPEAFQRAVLTDKTKLPHARLMTHSPRWIGTEEVLHAHLLVAVERGLLLARLDGKEIHLPAGSVCWIPTGTTRQLQVLPGVACRNWRVRFSVKRDNTWLGLNCPPLVRGDCELLIPHLQLLSEARADPRLEAERVPLLAALLVRFLSLPALSDKPTRQLDGVQRRRVEDLVKRGLLEGITPRDMAAAAGLSADYFTRLFKTTYGVPPRKYLLQQRMELAGEILRDSALSVKEVCAELSEPDVGTFCRLFKQVTGHTPSQWRNQVV